MKGFSFARKDKKRNYSRIQFFAQIFSPVFGFLFYACLVVAAISLLCAAIIFFVNTPIQDILLPPFMRLVKENDTITGYNIFVGNGVRIFANYKDVTLNHIKTVIYAGIAVTVAVLVVLAPIFRFLSRLLSNVSKKKVLDVENARYINYIGLTIMIGNTVALFVSRFYNYLLIKIFIVENSNIFLSLSIDLLGIILGIFLLLIGCIYGYACQLAQEKEQENSKKETVINLNQ